MNPKNSLRVFDTRCQGKPISAFGCLAAAIRGWPCSCGEEPGTARGCFILAVMPAHWKVCSDIHEFHPDLHTIDPGTAGADRNLTVTLPTLVTNPGIPGQMLIGSLQKTFCYISRKILNSTYTVKKPYFRPLVATVTFSSTFRLP